MALCTQLPGFKTRSKLKSSFVQMQSNFHLLSKPQLILYCFVLYRTLLYAQSIKTCIGNMILFSSFHQLLIHLHQRFHAGLALLSPHWHPIGLHDGAVVVLVGLAQLERHGQFAVKVPPGCCPCTVPTYPAQPWRSVMFCSSLQVDLLVLFRYKV